MNSLLTNTATIISSQVDIHPANNTARVQTRAASNLVKDLKARGLLEDTLVIWGGEFGRTVYSQGG